MEAPRNQPTTLPADQTFPTGRDMRDALAGFPSGVVLVTARVNDQVVGMLASSFTSVSLDPPLVSVSFARTSTTWPLLRRAQTWGISVLGERQAGAVALLSRSADVRFDGVTPLPMPRGGLVLPDAPVTLTVTRHAEIDAGDHVLTLLRVLELERDTNQPPLVIYDRAPRRIAA